MLDIDWTTEEPAVTAGQLLVVPLRSGHDPEAITQRFGAAVRDAVARVPFAGKPGESFAFTRERDGVIQHVTLMGADALTEPASLRQLAHDAAREAQRVGASQLVLDLHGADGLPAEGDDALRVGNLVAQGVQLGTYVYDRFLSESNRRPSSLRSVTAWGRSAAPTEGSNRGRIVADAIARARDLGNGPPALVTPSYLAQVAADMVAALAAEGHDVKLTVLDADECKARGMGCFLGVGQGSDEPPKFIHLAYSPKGESKARVALIGKGVTFDSGGYSLKPTDGMLDMKLDMCGAAAVIGSFEGAVRLGVPYELHALVAAAENLVSGKAYKLGDVLTASNGKTVEINNTDAEGRLTMADAMVYASKLEPALMIDFATLTGACIIALGPRIAGVMTNDQALHDDWMAAAARSGEDMWRLPLPSNLKEQLKSKVADMRNTGERWGGALTAGLFLSEFTEGIRWMHIDIAGPAMASKAYGVTTPGASGVPVATILELLSGPIQLEQS
ncbi:leucyl aminopeptidase [Paraliomyxa miuraensis]|uniref:leucyl aminopeptidase n=1 Tax=Paraliomyxa miuraensis TaxID=376150 RepID=UPI0022501B93|nr:leucyl aminopeptidase [Paraliomyxa miuraensis]MCX4244288.1 leucyl aminopeptidase [Paraliomyxa miuraensis]